MSWIFLILAIVFEVIGTSTLKMIRNPFSIQTVLMVLAYMSSMFMLSLTLKRMDIGVAYAIWSGLGITAIEVIGAVFYKESLSLPKIVFISFILIGTVGLNFCKTA